MNKGTLITNIQNTRTWIFQANPDVYKIYESLTDVKEELWNLRQYQNEIKIGDRVLLWISGSSAGIYAIGTVLTSPVPMEDSPNGQLKWTDKKDGERIWPRVQVRYDNILDPPLLKIYIQHDPGLWSLTIIRSPRMTNYKITDSELSALKDWLPNL